MTRRHFTHFNIAGFTYYEGCIAFNELTTGLEAQLIAEENNIHDENAVAIYHKEYKLGFIPRDKNQAVAEILRTGADIFEARIQRISPELHTEEQVQVIVYTKVPDTSKATVNA